VINFTSHMRILVGITPIDMRKGIDGVALACRKILQEDPMSGAIFIFTNRSRKMLRILSYDDQGFWLCTKRLSKGSFPYWPWVNGKSTMLLQAHEAHVLIRGGNPAELKTIEPWKKIVNF